MDLASMREYGARSVEATCQTLGCGQEAIVNMDGRPDEISVPDIGLKLKCSRCGSRDIKIIPD
ncbi:hypothetical protein DC522_08320 [Microvirga sp. KLBC 81]|nr:hypothetical protein DC522_08320 [Microvirga sp. KLBC 81]